MGGDIDAVFYDGNIFDAPWDIVVAINHALTVLSWFENLPEDEQPPRHIWWSGELVGEWFENVRLKRHTKSSGRKSSYEQAEDAPMDDNELAKNLRPSA